MKHASDDEASDDDTFQCISDRLDAVIRGNPNFFLDCTSTGILESDYMSSSEMPASYTMAASGLRVIHEWLRFYRARGRSPVYQNGSHECITRKPQATPSYNWLI